MIEFSFTCPHCWEMQLKLIDSSVNFHSFIEDCEVCCKPIEVSFEVHNGEMTSFSAKRLDE